MPNRAARRSVAEPAAKKPKALSQWNGVSRAVEASLPVVKTTKNTVVERSQRYCSRGHEFTETNTTWRWQVGTSKWHRQCVACAELRRRADEAGRKPGGHALDDMVCSCNDCANYSIAPAGYKQRRVPFSGTAA